MKKEQSNGREVKFLRILELLSCIEKGKLPKELMDFEEVKIIHDHYAEDFRDVVRTNDLVLVCGQLLQIFDKGQDAVNKIKSFINTALAPAEIEIFREKLNDCQGLGEKTKGKIRMAFL